jgi:integrase
MPLRVIYRRAVARDLVAINPTDGLELPAVRGRRTRIADPAEAELLIAAVPERDRPVWATAMYAGLRAGELQALRWSDVDLAAGVIRVERSYDRGAHADGPPKSAAGRRRVPILGTLRDVLVELRMASSGDGLVFGGTRVERFPINALVRRARTAWQAAGLAPILLHECRHTFASLMIAAGVNPKALQTYMGHANIATTMDLYGHLTPGAEAAAAALADAYLERANALARAATATNRATRSATNPEAVPEIPLG